MTLFYKITVLFGNIFLVFIALLLLYFVLAWILSRIPVNSKKKNISQEVPVYILSNGVHTDIVMPVKSDLIDWSEQLKFEHTKSKDKAMEFIAIGWGDKGFYLDTPEWSDLKLSVAFKAAFYLSTSAMHITFYKQMTAHEKCIKVEISKEEYQKLIDYIKCGFQYDEEGNMILIHASTYGVNDSFYEAKGVYSFFYTCNTWANNALKAAGQKACFWTVFDKGILHMYKDRTSIINSL